MEEPRTVREEADEPQVQHALKTLSTVVTEIEEAVDAVFHRFGAVLSDGRTPEDAAERLVAVSEGPDVPLAQAIAGERERLAGIEYRLRALIRRAGV